MAELVPSVLLYGQALKLLEDIRDAQVTDATEDNETLVRRLADVLTRFEDGAGRPLVNYEPVAETEPPSSEKANRFWKAAERDINLLQQQMDILKASAVFSHNLISTEILNAYAQNARVNNKLKTLQLYSNTSDSSIISFGDSFKSLDFVDTSLVPQAEQPNLAHEGYVTLGRIGELINLSEDSNVKILENSNGFLGNNQEIEDPNSAPTDPNTGATSYTFKSEVKQYDNMGALLDDQPNTWMEYEAYKVSSSDKLSALNMNFVYVTTDEDGEIADRADWANGPSGGILKLGLEFDLKQIKNINSIEFTPYGLEDNSNYPVLVKQIQTSPNGTDWTSIYPSTVWVGTEVNLRTARVADHVVTQKAVWAFESRAARYVRAYLEQHHPVSTNIGHVYWLNGKKTTPERVEGPNPPVSEPDLYYSKSTVGNAIQRRESFVGKRWAIGVRDFTIQQAEYVERSVLVSRPLRVGGVIDRVLLESADMDIPLGYDSDKTWVRFYVTPDEGENWYEISRIEDSIADVPEQISFNDPLHDSLREKGVVNYNTDNPVISIRLKIELLRPSDKRSTTPVLRSYVIKVKRR